MWMPWCFVFVWMGVACAGHRPRETRGVGIVSLKDELGKKKNDKVWIAYIFPGRPLFSITHHHDESQLFLLKLIPGFANINRSISALCSTLHQDHTAKSRELQHKRYRSQLKQGVIFRSEKKERKEKKAVLGFCNLIWSLFLRGKKIPSMAFSIQSDFYLAPRKRRRDLGLKILEFYGWFQLVAFLHQAPTELIWYYFWKSVFLRET